jgi:hypothetical protein
VTNCILFISVTGMPAFGDGWAGQSGGALHVACQIGTDCPVLPAEEDKLHPIRCRYVLGRSGRTLYVAFLGTSQARDWVADAQLLQENIWRDAGTGKQVVRAAAVGVQAK